MYAYKNNDTGLAILRYTYSSGIKYNQQQQQGAQMVEHIKKNIKSITDIIYKYVIIILSW